MDRGLRHCTGDRVQDHPQEKKWPNEKALQTAEKRREVEGKGERKDTPI